MLLTLALLAASAHAEPPAPVEAPSVTTAALKGPIAGERFLAMLSGGEQTGKVWLKVGPGPRKGTFEITSILSELGGEGPPAGHLATFVVDASLAVQDGVSEERTGDEVTSRTTWKVRGGAVTMKQQVGDDVRKARVDADRALHTGLEVGLALAEALAAQGIGRWSAQELSWDAGAPTPVWNLSEIDVTGAAEGGDRALPTGTVRVTVSGPTSTEVLVGPDGRVAEVSLLGSPTQLVACPPADLVGCRVVADSPDEKALRDAFAAMLARVMLDDGPEALTTPPAALVARLAGGQADVAAVGAAVRTGLGEQEETLRTVARLRSLVDADVTGDEATVSLTVSGKLRLVRVDGTWRIPTAD